MKINYVFGILGFVFGVFGSYVAYVFSIFSSSLMTNGTIALVSGIIGLLGLLVFNKDYRIAGLLYILGGVGVLIGVSLAGVLGFIFYIVAGVLAFVEKDKAETNVNNNFNPNTNNTHYYGDNQDNHPAPMPKQYDEKLWLIPIIAVIIIALVAVGGSSDLFNFNTETIEVSNISISSEGYSMYTVSCDIVPKQQYDYLEMQVVFYDSNNAVIGKSPLVWNVNNPAENQVIKASGTAMTDNENTRPARAEIYFYDSALQSDPSEAIYTQNVTINS